MKKSICIQLSDEVKKSCVWLSEIKQQNNFESLVEESLKYILSLDSECENDGESDLSRILKKASREKVPENIISDKEEYPLSIYLDEEVVDKVKEKFKKVYNKNKYVHISFILKNSLKAYALYWQDMSEDTKELKLSLSEFISICNKCNFKLLKEGTPKQDEKAKNLAKVFAGYKANKAELENDTFYRRIRQKIDGNNYYKFLQEDELYAEIDALEPYIYLGETNKKILNQKWHVLIAWLAFLDMASFDEECDSLKKWDKGKIEYIEIKKTAVYVKQSKKIRKTRYPSKYMCEWIWKAIENDRRLKK